MAERFFASLEREVLNRRPFKSQAEARMAIFEWIEGWYNPHRRHSGLGYVISLRDQDTGAVMRDSALTGLATW